MKAIRLIHSLLVVGLATGLVTSGKAQPTGTDKDKPATTSSRKTTDVAAKSQPQLQQRYPRYCLAPGDSFDITFELSPEFNQTVTVQPDGFITLREVGDMHVSGLTAGELTVRLRQAYGKILNKPIISVLLKDFEKPYFIADGQIGKPGKYELRGDTTLTQAVAIAGGFLDTSKHSQVLLFRRIDDHWTEARIINVKKMEKSGNLTEDMFLRPGDMIFVPKSQFAKIQRFLPNSSVGTFIGIQGLHF